MRISTVAALMIITTVLLSACTQDHLAELDDRGNSYYGSTSNPNAVYQAVAVDSISTAPLSAPTGTATNYSYSTTTTPVAYRATNVPFGGPTPAPGEQRAAVAPQAPTFSFTSGPAPVAAPTVTTTVATNTEWQWPVNGRVTTRFGQQAQGISNEGITIAAAAGAPIRAAASGEVAYVGRNVRDYGNMVILRHPGGEMTSYGHAKDIIVNKGDRIAAGDIVGHVGQTGNAPAPELHFALREGTRAVDPLSKLPNQVASR